MDNHSSKVPGSKSMPRFPKSDKISSYYKEIGEKSAVYAFKKPKLTLKHKITSFSPRSLENKISSNRNNLVQTSSSSFGNLITYAKNPQDLKNIDLSPEPKTPSARNSKKEKELITFRDISHIKDGSQPSQKKGFINYELPVDIKQVKKIVENFERHLLEATHESSKNQVRKLIESNNELCDIEKAWNLGPSSRQECVNLQKWMKKMKETLPDEQLFDMYSLASIEVTRQVSIHCIERGEILNEILSFFLKAIKSFENSQESLLNDISLKKQNLSKEFKDKEKDFQEKLIDFEILNKKLNKKIQKRNKKISDLESQSKEISQLYEDIKNRLDNYKANNQASFGNKKENISKNKKKIITFNSTARYQTQPFYMKSTQTDPSREFFSCDDAVTQTQNYHLIVHQGIGIEILSASKKKIRPRKNTKVLEAQVKHQKKRSSTSTSRAYNLRPRKTSSSPIVELCRKVKERDKVIMMLNTLLKNSGSTLEIPIQPQKKKELPNIVIQKPENDFDIDIESYQAGFEAGFENGYQLGTSYPNEEDSSSELFEDSSGNSEMSQEENLSIAEESISCMEDSEVDEIETKDQLGIKADKKSRNLILNTKLLENPELFGGYSPRSNVIPLSKVIEYNLNQKFYKDSKRSLPLNILEEILDKNIKWVKRKANVSKKMVNKLISSFYQLFNQRSDFQEPMLYYIYEDFLQKSGLKKLGQKKFIHFISSLIVLPNRRASNFLRFIGGGAAVKQENFLHYSLKFYLECFACIQSSKLGICSFDDTADRNLIPVSRALECIKDKLEPLSKKLSPLLGLIEENTEPDPKKLNKNGVIEIEFLLEIMIDQYEEYVHSIISGVEIIVTSIKYEEDQSYLTLREIEMIFDKMFKEKIKYEEWFLIDKVLIEDFCEVCINKNVLKKEYVFEVISMPGWTGNEVIVSLRGGVNDMLEKIAALKEEKAEKYERLKDVKKKVKTLERSLHKRECFECFIACEIYKHEVLKNS